MPGEVTLETSKTPGGDTARLSCARHGAQDMVVRVAAAARRRSLLGGGCFERRQAESGPRGDVQRTDPFGARRLRAGLGGAGEEERGCEPHHRGWVW